MEDHTILFYNVADALVATTLASLASLFQIRTLFSPRGEKEYWNLMEYDATGGGFVALWLVFAADGENEAGTLKRPRAKPAGLLFSSRRRRQQRRRRRRRRAWRKARALEDTRYNLVDGPMAWLVATSYDRPIGLR